MPNLRRFALCLWTLFGLLAATPAAAQYYGSLMLTFEVQLDDSTTPWTAPGLVVVLTNEAGTVHTEKLTDTLGVVQFSWLPPGTYQVVTLHPEVAPQTFANIRISADNTRVLTLSMRSPAVAYCWVTPSYTPKMGIGLGATTSALGLSARYRPSRHFSLQTFIGSVQNRGTQAGRSDNARGISTTLDAVFDRRLAGLRGWQIQGVAGGGLVARTVRPDLGVSPIAGLRLFRNRSPLVVSADWRPTIWTTASTRDWSVEPPVEGNRFAATVVWYPKP